MLLFFRNETASAATTASPTSSASSTSARQRRHARHAVRADRRGADRLLPDGARHRRQQVRARAAGHPRRRDAGHVQRYNRWLQAQHLDAVGGDVRRGGGLVRAAGGHHQPGRDEPGASIEIAIWAPWVARHARRPIVGAFFVNGAKSWFTVAFPSTGCSS